ncbi:tubulin polyglutamylase complex subunit 2 [Phyllostomus discolor]|uniref:Tubulin polyglutamylase complex subunit 2 n=3 Tax=Phyllostomus discolor TaxID=89673 RepID=A0A7E6CDD5_9CHIR|nr:tubulin polyglutamylase complex subunit 2 [Phyllostomus discolor]
MAEARGRCATLRPVQLTRLVSSAAPAARGAGTRAMEELPPPPVGSSKPLLEKLTLGITRILDVWQTGATSRENLPKELNNSESSPGVTEVTIREKPPVERHMISSWEQKNNCVLPEDVKNFYLMTNGFQMTWSVKLDEHAIPLGSMEINSIAKLTELNQSSMYSLPNAPTLADLEDDIQEACENQPEKPHFDSRSVIFELDPCNGNGKVCLVYKNGKPALAKDTEIWFLDRALYWHFLTDTFTAYYRLLITHLGLPQWQYAFTNYGVSPQAKQWFNMYKPITYNTNPLSEETDCFVNKLDPSKVFKSKNKVLIPKKKGPVQPAGGQKGPSAPPSTPKASSGSGNPARK